MSYAIKFVKAIKLCQNREHIFKLIDLQYPLTKTIASLPPLDHDEKVIVGVEVAELVVAPEREPEVGAEVELAVVPQVRGQRHLRQQLREGLLQRGHRQVARPRPRVAPLQILAVAPERVPTDGVCLASKDR